MKKFMMLVALALPMVFASCSSDEDETAITLDKSALEVSYQGTGAISTETKNVKWTSDNEFVATVDEKGVVTGIHCGEANIVATKGELMATCKVTVLPTNMDYVMPYLTWGATVAEVESAFKGFEKDPTSTSTTLNYWTNCANKTYPAYQYLFNGKVNDVSYNGLYTAGLLTEGSADDDVISTTINKMNTWVSQYYKSVQPGDNDSDDTVRVYENGEGVRVAVLDALYTIDDPNNPAAFELIWTVPATKGANADLVKAAKDAARQMVK